VKPLWKYLLIALAVVLVDQSVKLGVKLNMALGEEFNVVGDLFKIHFVENPGAAFGLTFTDLFGLSSETGKLILTLLSFVLTGLIAYYLRAVAAVPTALPLLIALILGGAVGNMVDRTFYGLWFAGMNDYEGGLLHGRVVDMFYLDLWQGTLPEWVPLMGGRYYSLWPIFNIADACISCSIVVLLVLRRHLLSDAALGLPVAAAPVAAVPTTPTPTVGDGHSEPASPAAGA